MVFFETSGLQSLVGTVPDYASQAERRKVLLEAGWELGDMPHAISHFSAMLWS